ncbi:Uncharacterised protein [Salmonella enterica subsp. arizonae]|nr:Uncharacterised protein [Salmonella enterica subsp. arizonae]
MKSLLQANVMFHDPFKQRQTRAHKAVFHFKTGKLVQSNPQQTIPPRMLAGQQTGPCSMSQFRLAWRAKFTQ